MRANITYALVRGVPMEQDQSNDGVPEWTAVTDTGNEYRIMRDTPNGERAREWSVTHVATDTIVGTIRRRGRTSAYTYLRPGQVFGNSQNDLWNAVQGLLE